MAEARPFRGIRFSTRVAAEDPDGLLCPPYDIISPEQQQGLLARHPFNAVRLELPGGSPDEASVPNRYTNASDTFARWLGEGVLERDGCPAFYLFRHWFQHGGKTYRRLALLAAVRLEEFDKGIVLPHEHTTPAPKRDRLALMRACHVNFSPLMVLYRDPGGEIGDILSAATKERPAFAAKDAEGLPCELWVLSSPDVVCKLQQALEPQPLYIADGHHRYETALAYRDEVRGSVGDSATGKEAFNYVLLALTSFDDPGLLVLPYHRVLGELTGGLLERVWSGLGGLFEASSLDVPEGELPGALLERVSRQARAAPAIGVVAADGTTALLRLRPEVDLASMGAPGLFEAWLLEERALRPVLGKALAEHIVYIHDAREALQRVREGEGQIAFFLRALPMGLFESVVGRGIRLPPKSTYFYPKLPTGLVFNPLEGEL